MAEGYLKKQTNGKYGISDDYIDLSCGKRVEVKTAQGWILMRVEHDELDYYFIGDGISFYPKRAYVRY